MEQLFGVQRNKLKERVNTMKEYFHFKVIKAFMDKIYREAILSTNLVNDGEELFLDTIWKLSSDGAVEGDLDANFKNVVLAMKGNEKYIIPIQFIKSLPFVPTESFNCYYKKADRKVWKFVTGIKSILLPPNKNVNVRQYVDSWNPIEHSNQQAWTFLKMVALSTRYMGSKLCIASAPALGKNAHLTIISEITRDTLITSTPSIAKYETALYYNKCINLNEMGKPKSEEADAIRDLIMWLGDQSVRYNKRSMAVKRELSSLDLTHISNIVTYNRKSSLKGKAVFFDDIFSNPGAIKNRYPQFLFDGSVIEVVKDMSNQRASELAEQYDKEIKELISGLMGIPEAVKNQKKDFSTSLLQMHSRDCTWGFTPRQLTNIQGLLEFISAYCDNQDEFNDWLLFINNGKLAYDDMVINDVSFDAETETLKETETVTPSVQKKYTSGTVVVPMTSASKRLDAFDSELI